VYYNEYIFPYNLFFKQRSNVTFKNIQILNITENKYQNKKDYSVTIKNDNFMIYFPSL